MADGSGLTLQEETRKSKNGENGEEKMETCTTKESSQRIFREQQYFEVFLLKTSLMMISDRNTDEDELLLGPLLLLV